MKADRELLELAAKAAGMVIYDQITGSMRWKPKDQGVKDAARWNSRYSGKECGTLDDKGYVRVLIRFEPGKTFKIRVHRLAWFIVNGVLPSYEIDHINQNKSDNRIVNLRDVPKGINQRNGTRKGNNTSGVAGVTWHKQHKKWYAQANVDGKHHFAGLFHDLATAGDAVKKLRERLGFTSTHGRIV